MQALLAREDPASAGNGLRAWMESKVTALIALTINGNARSFDVDRLSVAGLVERMGLTGKRIAIERNGEIVPRAAFAETVLQSGDKLEIVGAVGGG